jgi:hypothetical protein
MRILFLDFDGVINSARWMRARPPKDIAMEMFPGHEHERMHLRSIDPEAVKVLDRLVTQLCARVVVSSSWRQDLSLPKLNYYLQYHGFTHMLLGTTPDSTRWNESGLFVTRSRGAEIVSWLALLPPGLVGPRDYIILDDEEVTGHGDRLYQLDHAHGLREEDIDPIIASFE